MLLFILFLPLASFALISLALRKHPNWAITTSVGVAIANAALALRAVTMGPAADCNCVLAWLNVDSLQVFIGFSWDHLAQLMVLIVTCVGALIHIYSTGYMKDDPSQPRFFAYLSLFMFSMLGIVLANNLLMMFIFWELVGLSSYLLIGFWYEKSSAADAGKKAFLVNKLGDFGFMIGILFVWTQCNTVDFKSLAASPEQLKLLPWWVGLLLFCGAAGKSAQFPLHVWLPDAMEGPTPVSALIHAATMVAAGVYMLCRIFFILKWMPEALVVIAWTGAITALLAALWAIAQEDIKRILAYSTLSQLGYMVMAVGLGSPASAMFHLSTHATFKALLFLGAGSVIVALHHEQNIWKMGGIGRKMIVTSATFLIGMLALCGVLGSAGALSKDAILSVAFEENKWLFGIGVFTAFLTSFYMGRLFLVVFCGKPKNDAAKHAHENGPEMVLPLLFLALFSCYYFWSKSTFIHETLETLGGLHHNGAFNAVEMLLIIIPLLGLAFSYVVYSKAEFVDPLSLLVPRLRAVLASKFRIDEIYDSVILKTQEKFSFYLKIIDVWIIDGLGIKVPALLVLGVGNVFRCFQTGNLQTYVLFFGMALAGLLYWTLR